MKLIFRITDKTGSRIERHTLSSQVITIGRGWDNDIILQDPFVDAEHLSISLLRSGDDAGSIELSDLETTNGTTLSDKRVAKGAQRYSLGEPIDLGDTQIEILDASAPVKKTAVRSFWFFVRERFNSLPSLLWLTVAALAITVIDAQYFAVESSKLSSALLVMSFTLVVLFLWSLVFGFIGKLLRGESNIRTHWALACMSLIVITVLAWLVFVLRFNLQAVDVSQALMVLVFGSVAAVLLYALFTYATYMGPRAKWLGSMVLVLSVVPVIYSDSLFSEPHERWTSQAKVESSNLPPVFMLREAIKLDQYMQDSGKLFDDLNASQIE